MDVLTSRRTIDPPPVLQVLINDFDLEKDGSYLRANDWVVHAKLVSAQNPEEDMNMLTTHTNEGHQKEKVTRLLLGTTVSSPFFCADDPDPETAPRHPITRPLRPPSPSERFMPRHKRAEEDDPEAHTKYPGIYFIFADLSVRKAGQYRLEFRLMKMEPSALQTGNIVPTISVAVSDVFNVVNAKDFDQVQPSTDLVKGLLNRGAGFPLKLKKGLREGQTRRRARQDSDDEEVDVQVPEEEDDDDHDNEEG